MTELEKLVGLSPIDTGEGRMYVNRMPNVSHELIEAIAENGEKSTDDLTGLATVWSEIKTEAYEKLKTEVLNEFSKRSNFIEVLDATKLPVMIADKAVFTAQGDTVVGVLVVTPVSRYQSVFVRNVFAIFGSAKTEVNVRIIDVDFSDVLYNGTIEVESGRVLNIPVNFSIDCNTVGQRCLFVGVVVPDGEQLLSFDWNSDCMYSENELVYAPETGLITIDSFTDEYDCFVAPEYELRLSIDKIADRFADRLRRVFAILCAIGIVDRSLKSKAASKWTLVNRDYQQINLDDLRADMKKELAAACRLVYTEVKKERLTLVSNPEDQQDFYLGSYV